MFTPPKITVTIPWDYSRLAKSLQKYSRKASGIKLGASTRGFKVTATTRTFLKMRLAKVSDQYDLPLVSRLREADLKVNGSRTVHLPGNLSVVEIKLDASPKVAHKAAMALLGSAGAQVVTIYDRAGTGHTAAQEGVMVGEGSEMVGRSGGRQGSPGWVQAGVTDEPPEVAEIGRALDSLLVNPDGALWADSAAWYNPGTGQCNVSVGDGVGNYDKIEQVIGKIVGPENVEVTDEGGPPTGPGWIRILEQEGRLGSSRSTDDQGKSCPDGECCPHCGARLERGDNGKCNRCGKPWPESKTARRARRCAAQNEALVRAIREIWEDKSATRL